MGRPRAARSLRPVAPRLAKDAALIWTTKLLFSLATLCFGIGYGARWRANPLHRQLMAGGIAIGWTGAGLYALGRLAFGLSGRPAYWLVEAAGSASTAAMLAAMQQGCAVLVLLLLTAQAALGRMRHPRHGTVARVALPLWLLLWVTSMFGYL